MEIKKEEPRLILPATTFLEENEGDLVSLTPIDLRMPKYQMPMIFAFLTPPPSDFLPRFENALQNVLDQYRVLAGRILQDKIKLSNEGVPLIEATVTNMELKEYLTLEFGFLHHLTPSSTDISIPLMIQVTEFSCGSVTLGFARHHHVVDSNAYPFFLNDLAASVRLNHPVLSQISHNRACLMARSPPLPRFDHPDYKSSIITAADPSSPIASARIHFSAERLRRLKAECNSAAHGESSFSTFVSLTSFLWKALTRARGVSGQTRTVCLCPVNGRRVLKLPADYFGNAVFRACAEASAEEVLEKPLSFLAGIIDCNIKRLMDPEFMRSIVDFLALEQQRSSDEISKDSGEVTKFSCSPHLVITSWARLPLYNVDLGFGRPHLVAPTDLPWEGYVTVAPSGEKDGGLEVIANLYKHHLTSLLSLL